MKRILLMMSLVLLAGWSLGTSPERRAYDQAKTLIGEKYRTHVLSIYGQGSPKEIQVWHFNFFDPESPTKAKAVVIKDGKIDLLKPVEGRHSYDDGQSFDPNQSKASVEAALKTAKTYAEQNQITYDATTVLMQRPEKGKAPAWSVELRQQGHSRGFVQTEAGNGSFAGYQSPSQGSAHENSGGKGFARDVEDTFRGIGADLEEFFTGKRTVDQ